MPWIVIALVLRLLTHGLEGAVEEYFSTDCSCVVTTVFQTTPSKNRLEGAYVTSNAGGFRQQGRWSAERLVIAADDDKR